MELLFNNKLSEKEILDLPLGCTVSSEYNGGNALFYGDNLQTLCYLLKNCDLKGKVDLIYIDPPFATNNDFSLGVQRTSTVSASKSDALAYSDKLLGDEFFAFLRNRLVFAKELLADSGSIYLHIDYKIGHYVKLIMDEIFGVENFRNDISRIKCNPKNFARRAYGNVKDMILFYTKGNKPVWNEPYTSYSTSDIERLYKKTDVLGRHYTTIPLHAPGESGGATGGEFRGILPPKGRHWRSSPEELEALDKAGRIEWSDKGVPRKIIYADEQKGKRMQDIWEFKDNPYPCYPTEKNFDLLKQIIATSSNESGLVLDFFCGSGSTLLAAEYLGRNWIGVDNSSAAIELTKSRLAKEMILDYDFIELISALSTTSRPCTHLSPSASRIASAKRYSD